MINLNTHYDILHDNDAFISFLRQHYKWHRMEYISTVEHLLQTTYLLKISKELNSFSNKIVMGISIEDLWDHP